MGRPEDAADSPTAPALPNPSSPAGLGFLRGHAPPGLRGGARQCRGGCWLLCPAIGHLILLQEELGGQGVSRLLGSHVSLAVGSSGAPAVPRHAEPGGTALPPPQPCPHLHCLGWPGLPQLLRRPLRLRVTRVILIFFGLLDGGGLSGDRGTPGLLFALFRDPLLAPGVRGQVRGERVVDVVGRLAVVWGDWELVLCSLPISCPFPTPSLPPCLLPARSPLRARPWPRSHSKSSSL